LLKIGSLLRRLRESRGWSQLEAAAKSGLSQVHICQLEHDKNFPKLETLKKLADAFGVTCELIVWYSVRPDGDATLYDETNRAETKGALISYARLRGYVREHILKIPRVGDEL